jgi:hypothetical protein
VDAAARSASIRQVMRRRAAFTSRALLAALSAGVVAGGAYGHPSPKAHSADTKRAKPVREQLLFDGRATRLDTLWSTGPNDQSSTPHIWDGLLFLNNDISLTSDGRYGKVYSVRAGAGSTNPFFNVGSDKASAETSARRPNRLGKWDWYGIAVRVEPGFTPPEWCTVAQFNYPSLSAPPASLNLRAVGGRLYWSLARNAGFLFRPTSWGWEGRMREEPLIIPASIGAWTEFVIGIMWATDTTGQIRVYSRVKDAGDKRFRLRLVRRGTPTWQYGETPSGNVRADGTDAATGQQHRTLDKQGLYFGFSRPPSVFPTNRVTERGLIRASNADDAFARMP